MSIYNQLSQRTGFNSADIEEIVALAEQLQQEERRHKERSVQQTNLKKITRELDIEDQHVQEAIRQIKKRKETMNRNYFSRRDLLFGGVAIALLLLTMAIFFNSPDEKIEVVVNTNNVIQAPTNPQLTEKEETPDPTPLNTTVNIQQTVVNINTPPENPVAKDNKTTIDNKPPAVIPQPKEVAKSEINNASLQAVLQGEWELVSYHLYDDGDYFSVPVTKDKIELREAWNFGENRFRHIMDKSLTFSGKYTLLEPVSLPQTPQILQNSSNFTLYCTKISSSFGSKKEQNYYYGQLTEDQLIIYYLGSKIQSNLQPKQGHEFRKISP